MGSLIGILAGGWNLARSGLSLLGSFLKSLNAQGVVGLIASLVFAYIAFHQWSEARHWRKQSTQYANLYARETRYEQHIAAHALALKSSLDALGVNISTTLKGLNDAQNVRIARAADAFKLSGPGKAACSSHSEPSASASGSVAPGGAGNAAVAPVPGEQGLELIGLPFAGAVDFAQQADLNRTEVVTWRVWYRRLLAAWPREKK